VEVDPKAMTKTALNKGVVLLKRDLCSGYPSQPLDYEKESIKYYLHPSGFMFRTHEKFKEDWMKGYPTVEEFITVKGRLSVAELTQELDSTGLEEVCESLIAAIKRHQKRHQEEY
jgi:hypothetical protein